MIILDDIKLEPPTNSTHEASSPRQQPYASLIGSPAVNEPHEQLGPPPAYEAVVHHAIPHTPRAQIAPGAFAGSVGLLCSSRPSLHPHYYSSDSYGGNPASSSSRSLLSIIGDKLIPPNQPLHDPPTLLPPSFTRLPAPNLPYGLFPPTYLIDFGYFTFPVAPPSSHAQPHPFITHDVTEEDWSR